MADWFIVTGWSKLIIPDELHSVFNGNPVPR